MEQQRITSHHFKLFCSRVQSRNVDTWKCFEPDGKHLFCLYRKLWTRSSKQVCVIAFWFWKRLWYIYEVLCLFFQEINVCEMKSCRFQGLARVSLPLSGDKELSGKSIDRDGKKMKTRFLSIGKNRLKARLNLFFARLLEL